jgi:hypothetical protein
MTDTRDAISAPRVVICGAYSPVDSRQIAARLRDFGGRPCPGDAGAYWFVSEEARSWALAQVRRSCGRTSVDRVD